MGYRLHAEWNVVTTAHKDFQTKYSTVAEMMCSVYAYYFDASYAAVYDCRNTGFACKKFEIAHYFTV